MGINFGQNQAKPTKIKEKIVTSKMMAEFKAFAVRGNVVDLAVGVIIGGAFGKIVDSLVNDIVMPLISSLLGGRIDFTNLFIVLGTVPELSLIHI